MHRTEVHASAVCSPNMTLQAAVHCSSGAPAPSSLDLSPERLKPLKFWPMLDINLLVCSPLGCDEAVIDIIYDIALPKGEYRGLGLGHILSPHAATHIPRLLIDLL